MARICYVCGKGKVVGGHITHRGLAKKSGGIRLQLVKNTKRTFKPNLQDVRIMDGQAKKKVKVCAACLRSNKVTKASKMPKQS